VAKVESADEIIGVVHVTPDVHHDERGLFIETYRRSWFGSSGREMVQANRADRKQGSLVGLHYHLHQADYWYVPTGICRVVLHDLRVGSPTHRNTMSFDIGGDDHRGVFIPPGLAHGFAALTDMTITYLVDGYYNPSDELGVAWNDPTLNADWGVEDPVVSERDQQNPHVADLSGHLLPYFGLRS
jgi:dTDP-4-dehydrorhamnose 3,5-epimerase